MDDEDRQFIMEKIVSYRSVKLFNKYITELNAMPSCKPQLYTPNEAYENCLLEKQNHTLEKIIDYARYNNY